MEPSLNFSSFFHQMCRKCFSIIFLSLGNVAFHFRSDLEPFHAHLPLKVHKASWLLCNVTLLSSNWDTSADISPETSLNCCHIPERMWAHANEFGGGIVCISVLHISAQICLVFISLFNVENVYMTEDKMKFSDLCLRVVPTQSQSCFQKVEEQTMCGEGVAEICFLNWIPNDFQSSKDIIYAELLRDRLLLQCF